MSEWRTINSAPKDGTHIFVVNASDPKTLPATVYWHKGDWQLSVSLIKGSYNI
jgi:hypothetical protein